MRKEKKYLSISVSSLSLAFVLLVVCSLFSLGSLEVMALSTKKTDIPIVQANIAAGQELSVENMFLRIHDSNFPHELAHEALRSLHAYACKEERLQDSLCNAAPHDRAESEYLYDHLVDVYLRYLDGAGVYDKHELVDPDAKARRDYLEYQHSQPDAAPSGKIHDKYKQIRGDGLEKTRMPVSVKYSQKSCKQFVDPISFGDLKSKYYHACDMALCTYRDMNSAMYDGKSASRAFNQERDLRGYNNCTTLVKRRIRKEHTELQELMITQGNRFASRAVEEYSLTYFVGNRLSRLFKKFTNTLNRFEMVNRKVVEGTKTCSVG